jgi:hypothetical protein
MKILWTIFLLCTFASAFDISIKSGKVEGKSYSIASLDSSEIPFICKENLDPYMKVVSITCSVERSFHDDIDDIKHPMLNMAFEKERDSFILTVTSQKNIKLFQDAPAFYEKPRLEYFNKTHSKHWTIVAYEEELPFLTQAKANGLNFPVPVDFENYPYIGPVDINSLPVVASSSADIEYYVRLEKTFDKGDYEESLRLAKELQEQFPSSIFMSDFIRYEMKSLFQLGSDKHFDSIVRIGKAYIRNFTSDEYLPEVLLLMAKTYSQTGFLSDSNYFFDRLINEHKNNLYGDLGKIAFGLHRYKNDDIQGGIETILDTFYNTKFLTVATKAAEELAKIYFATDIKESIKYLQVIWDNNKEYLTDQREVLYEYADKAASDESGWQLALSMYEALATLYDKNLHDEYSQIIYKIALMNDNLKNYEVAYKMYQRYLDDFSFAQYAQDAQDALNMLLVKQDSQNIDEKLANLDALIENNFNENVGQEALVAKMQILNDEGLFSQTIALHEKAQSLQEKYFTQANALLDTAFNTYLGALLEGGNCSEIDALIRRYDLTLDVNKFDHGKLFDCYFQTARYENAKSIAQQYLNDENLQTRAAWLCKIAQINLVKKEYAIAKDIYEDIFALNAQNTCESIYQNLFSAQKYTQDTQGMLASVQEIEKSVQGARLLPFYKDIVDASEDKEIKKIYLQKMLDLQQSLALNTYSPWLELQASSHFEPSLELARLLENAITSADTTQQARIFFEIGNIYSDLQTVDAAVENYDRCIAIDSMWKSLCEDAKGLVSN